MIVTDFKSTTSVASSITFSGVNLGPASADRKIAVGVVARGNAGGIVVSSVTVNGLGTVQRAPQLNGSNWSSVQVADVPSGETGSVAVAFNAQWSELHIIVASVRGTIHSWLAVQNASLSGQIDVPENGAAFAIAFASALTTFGWQGLAQDVPSSGTSRFSGARAESAAAVLLNVAANPAAASSPVMSVVSFAENTDPPPPPPPLPSTELGPWPTFLPYPDNPTFYATGQIGPVSFADSLVTGLTLPAGSPVWFSGASLPPEVEGFRTYYVQAASGGFRIATTKTGAPLSFGSGSGTAHNDCIRRIVTPADSDLDTIYEFEMQAGGAGGGPLGGGGEGSRYRVALRGIPPSTPIYAQIGAAGRGSMNGGPSKGTNTKIIVPWNGGMITIPTDVGFDDPTAISVEGGQIATTGGPGHGGNPSGSFPHWEQNGGPVIAASDLPISGANGTWPLPNGASEGGGQGWNSTNGGAGTPIGSGGGAKPGGIGLDGFPGAVIVRMWRP